MPIGLSPASALNPMVVPTLTSPHPLPSPLWVVPVKPPDNPRFTALCQLHTEEGNGPHHLVKCVRGGGGFGLEDARGNG